MCYTRMKSRKHDDSGDRAIGIEYTADAVGGLVTAAMAKELVVVSAGAFGSPSILERSGIGSSSILERHDTPVIVDLPGVGENYQGMSLNRGSLTPTRVTRLRLFCRPR